MRIVRLFFFWATIACSAILSLHAPQAVAAAAKVSWGNPDEPWGRRRAITPADRAEIAAYRSEAKKPTIDVAFTDPAELAERWTLQSDDEASLLSCRRPGNVVIAAKELQLRTLDASDCKNRWSTGAMISRFRQRYGFFEARMKITDVAGVNNAFWLVTDGHFEIDVVEARYPSLARLTLHNNNGWDVQKDDKMHAVGFAAEFQENLSKDYHDYGVLWTPTDLIYEIDGEPVAAVATKDEIKGVADVRFATAVMKDGDKIPTDPAGHDMYVRRLRVISYDPAVK